MHLCFVDESGTPPSQGKTDRRRFFVLAAVIMHESQWHGIDREVTALKARKEYQIRGEIKWRYFGSENTDKDNSVSHLDQNARDAFRAQLFSIITSRKSVNIIVCAADAYAAYQTGYISSAQDLYHYTYKPISERFQYHLQDLGRTVGEKQLGIMIADPRGKTQDDQLRKEHQRLLDSKSQYTSKYENYVETVFFTPSHLSVGIQLADMVAGAVGRALNSKDSSFARLVKPAFRRNARGQIKGHGFVRFPDRGWGVGPSGGGIAP